MLEGGRQATAVALGAEPCKAEVLISVCPQPVQACLFPLRGLISLLRFLGQQFCVLPFCAPTDLNRWYTANAD